jgi:hypothetical protein
MAKILFHPKTGISIILMAILICFQLFISNRVLTIDPPIHADEVFFSNVTNNYVKTRKMFMNLYGDSGIGQEHLRTLTYPPIYFYGLSVWTKLTSTSIQSYRYFSVLISVLTISLFGLIVFFLTEQSLISVCSSFILLVSSQFQMASRMTRMEMLVLFFFMTAIASVLRWRVNQKHKKWLILSSFFSIAAIFTHPIGLFVPIIELLIISVTSRKIALYTGIAIGTICIFGGLLWIGKDMQLFTEQMLSFVSYKTNRPMLLPILIMQNPIWTLYTGLLLLLPSLGIYRGMQKKERELIAVCISAFILFVIVTFAREQWYLLYLPVLPILIGTMLIKSYPRVVIPILGFIFLIHASWFWAGTGKAFATTPYYDAYTASIADNIPKNANVVVSALPDPYFALQKRSDLKLWETPNISEKEKLFNFLRTKDYAVVTHFTNPYFKEYVTNNAEKVTEVNVGSNSVLLIELTHQIATSAAY